MRVKHSSKLNGIFEFVWVYSTIQQILSVCYIRTAYNIYRDKFKVVNSLFEKMFKHQSFRIDMN